MSTANTESYANYLHLPPREAWKNPTKWLQPLDASQKLKLPLDDRGFVKTDDAIDMVMDLFHPWYKFEYDPENRETRNDIHHFYGTYMGYVTYREELIAAGDPNALIPMQFRNLPTNMGLLHRQIHNTFHLKSNLVPRPKLEPMTEYVLSYRIGKQILNKMVKAAENTIEWENRALSRQLTLQQRPEIIDFAEVDTYGQKILTDMHKRHFGSMVNALNEFNASSSKDIVLPSGYQSIERPDPHQIILIGKAAARSAIDYASQIQAS